ncbi:MAG: Holliday junction resolvase RuvX, partial [Calditrichaeota bacterium]
DDIESLRGIPGGRILGVDYGQKRVGLAMSDPFQMMASTLQTCNAKDQRELLKEICSLIQSHSVIAIVIGRPLHMSGERGTLAAQVEEFAAILSDQQSSPVFFWDERWTTVSAEKLLIETGKSPSRHRNKIDQIAAAYLLQSFLDRLNYIKRNE